MTADAGEGEQSQENHRLRVRIEMQLYGDFMEPEITTDSSWSYQDLMGATGFNHPMGRPVVFTPTTGAVTGSGAQTNATIEVDEGDVSPMTPPRTETDDE